MANYYTYELRDGRIAYSGKDLTHALTKDRFLDLSTLTPAESRQLSIAATEEMNLLMKAAMDGAPWLPPSELTCLSDEECLQKASSYKSVCVIQNGTVKLRNGRRFVALGKVADTGSRDTLAFYLWNVGLQAALAQMDLAKRENGK